MKSTVNSTDEGRKLLNEKVDQSMMSSNGNDQPSNGIKLLKPVASWVWPGSTARTTFAGGLPSVLQSRHKVTRANISFILGPQKKITKPPQSWGCPRYRWTKTLGYGEWRRRTRTPASSADARCASARSSAAAERSSVEGTCGTTRTRAASTTSSWGAKSWNARIRA